MSQSCDLTFCGHPCRIAAQWLYLYYLFPAFIQIPHKTAYPPVSPNQ